MKTWIPNHLRVEEELVFHNIPTDITEINKHLINSINVIGTKHKTLLMSREVGLDMIERNAEINIDRDIYTMVSPNDPKFVKANKISDIFNQPSNYSYGDLLLMIDKYETYFESEEHRRFTDAIKIYYSILLFETMFFKTQDVDYIYKEDVDHPVIPIQRLIGGNVYYPNYFEIITDKNFNQKGPSFDAKRAFYHKVKVDDSNKVGDDYPLFSVLYYGDIRPDRYEKDHIYDTTFRKNAEVDGVNYVTFDILSILNNMLNPCHTLSRLDNDKFRPRNWDDIIVAVQEWGDYNKVDGKFIPNAILPFYAVDVMLTYLRCDCSTDDLFKEASVQKPNPTNAISAANSIKIFFDSSSSMIDALLELLKEMSNEGKTSSKIENEKIKGIASKNNVTEVNKLQDAYVAMSEMDSDNVELLIGNLEIISLAHECFDKISFSICNDCDKLNYKAVLDMFRNHVIALIYGKSLITKKEKEAFVKELRGFSSVSEIYKHLVDVMWENKIKEICIRGKIQKEVRTFKVVKAYYNRLWKETEEMFGLIDGIVSSIKPKSVYENLFNEARKLFLES